MGNFVGQLFSKAIPWLARAIEDSHGEPSVKRLTYYQVIGVVLSFSLLALTVALLIMAYHDPSPEIALIIGDVLETIVITIASAVTGGYSIGYVTDAVQSVKSAVKGDRQNDSTTQL